MNRIGIALLRCINPRGGLRGALAAAALAASMPLALAQAPAQDDPPTRVGRVADVGGEIYHAPEDRASDWALVGRNHPVTTGDNLWVAEGGRAELDIGAGQVRLGPETNLYVARLDDRVVALFLAQGQLSLRLRVLDAGEVARIDTPNTQVVVTRPGLYRVEVSRDRDRTVLVVREGEATLPTAAGMQQVLPGQTAFAAGLDATSVDVRTGLATDGFDTWIAERDRRYERNRSTPYVSRQMVGSADLDDYGTWQQDTTYGAVWYPTVVDAGWAPYRDGSWTWVSPWGWTWVDAAPWGYAPFHYGRWVFVSGRWGWCPGSFVARPVWSPAMVGWVGGAGWAVSATWGTPVFGWVPLAWGEPFRPWWNRCSSRCWNGYNHPYAAPADDHVRRTAPPTYRNATRPGGITAVRGSAFAGEHSVSRSLVPVNAGQLAGAPTLSYAPPIDRPAAGRPASKPFVTAPPQAASSISRRDTAVSSRPPSTGGAVGVPAAASPARAPAYPSGPPASYAAPGGRPAPSTTYSAPVQRESLQVIPPSQGSTRGTGQPAAPPSSVPPPTRYAAPVAPAQTAPATGTSVPPPVRYAAPPAPVYAPQAPPAAAPARGSPQPAPSAAPSMRVTPQPAMPAAQMPAAPPMRAAPPPQPVVVPQVSSQQAAPRIAPAPVPQAAPAPQAAPQAPPAPAKPQESSARRAPGGNSGNDGGPGVRGGAFEKPGGGPR